MIETEAWVIYARPPGPDAPPAELVREKFCFPSPSAREVLVEPLIGCWEGNMSHALTRRPVDICRQRGEAKVIIGNGGVVRVLQVGDDVKGLAEGDLCLVFCNGVADRNGYPQKIWAYDAPGSLGLLSRRTKLTAAQLIKIPPDTRHSLGQWAAFSLRYITAWANWQKTRACWQAIRPTEEDTSPPWIFGWGGGATLAELTLARFDGWATAMSTADANRCKLITALGLTPLNRNRFAALAFDPERYAQEPDFKAAYQQAEAAFLAQIARLTNEQGLSVVVDYIGLPVYRASLKALARPGIITSAGWKGGMELPTIRAVECMNWHLHLHTHYARYHEGVAAVAFGEERGWMPPETGEPFAWEDVPELARQHIAGKLSTYFPLYSVNT